MNRDLKKISGLERDRTHDLCDAGEVLSQLSYQSHMAIVYGLALYMGTSRFGPSTGSGPEIFFRSLFMYCYGRTSINDRYHSVATMGQITFIITGMINHTFISSPAVRIYEISYIHFYSSPSTVTLRTHKVASAQLA